MKFLKWGLMLMFLTLAFFSCKDDDSILGENFLDGRLDLQFDTILNVSTLSTAFEDTTTVRSGASTAVIGDYQDDIFGDHKAFTAFSLVPQSNYSDTTVYYADTVMLYLQYRGVFYGYDIENPLTYTIHKVTDTLSGIDGLALSAIDISQYYDPTPLATAEFLPDLDSAASDQFLKFELPLEIGDSLLANWDKIEDNEEFVKYFKGFVIKATRQGGSGGIVSFNLTDTDSHLYLKFHSDEEDDLSFKFYISDSDNSLPTRRFNFFEHNYSTGSISQYMTSTDVPTFNENDELAFLQSMRGINMKVTVDMAGADFLSSDDDIVINRAYLRLNTINMETPIDTIKYLPPIYLSVSELVNDIQEPIVDYYVPSADASRTQVLESDSTGYEIILSGFTHEKLDQGGTEYTIMIEPWQTTINPRRGVIAGGTYPIDSLRPKVYITYSRRTNN
jgi:hypothetical protein